MAEMNGKNVSVESTDALYTGFMDAMKRVEYIEIDLYETMVDRIPAIEWASWDASEENALVVDLGFGDELGDDYEMVLAA